MLNFDNRLLRELPGEAESSNQPHAVHGALWSPVSATPVAAPRLLACSRDMARQLGIDEVAAEVLPDGKVAALKKFRVNGARVAFVDE